MGKTNAKASTIKADKLQEIIKEKTMESLSASSKKTSSKKAESKAEPKKATPKPKKAEAKGKEPKKVASTTREVKYKYPEECSDSLSRKKFRQEFRSKVKSYNNQLAGIKDQKSKEYLKLAKEFKDYTAKYMRG